MYVPKVHIIIKANRDKALTLDEGDDSLSTSFMAVTAYQNLQITQLKIDHNPFAKRAKLSGTISDQTYDTTYDRIYMGGGATEMGFPQQPLPFTAHPQTYQSADYRSVPVGQLVTTYSTGGYSGVSTANSTRYQQHTSGPGLIPPPLATLITYGQPTTYTPSTSPPASVRRGQFFTDPIRLLLFGPVVTDIF